MKLHVANNRGSTSVIIPKKIIEHLGWKAKDEVILYYDEDKRVIIENVSKKEL